MRAALANAMVRRKAELYGKGPERAKAYLNEEHVFVVLEGGLNASEELMIEAGEHDLVRRYRLRFQEVTAPQLTGDVEEITGRKVIGYHSQIVFEPTRIYEIFTLDAPPGGADA